MLKYVYRIRIQLPNRQLQDMLLKNQHINLLMTRGTILYVIVIIATLQHNFSQ